MAVAFDAISSAFVASNATSCSGTHTPVGTPTGVAVMVFYGFNGRTISSVTYGGTAMALEAEDSVSGKAVSIYKLANPASGAQTVAVNFSGAEYAHAYAVTVTGGDTTTVVDSGHSAHTNANSDTPSLNCTTASDELILDALTHPNATGSVDANQTQRLNAGAFGVYSMYSSTQAGSDGETMSWSMGGSGAYAHAAISFKASGGGGGGSVVPVLMNQYRSRWAA